MAKPSKLPALPGAVPTQLGPVRVVLVEQLATKRNKKGKRRKYFGRYRELPRIIEVSAQATPIMQAQTIFHEWVHVVLGDAGLHNVFTRKQQEIIADVIATARVVELLQDPPR